LEREVKQRADWEKSVMAAEVRIELQYHRRRKGGGGEGGGEDE